MSTEHYSPAADALVGAVRRWTPLPEEQETRLRRCAHEQVLNRGDVFIAEGTVPRHFGFVVHGLFRYYYLSGTGDEFTKGFFPEYSFITSYTAMVQRRASYYTIEALEQSRVLRIEYTAWQELYHSHPCWSALLLALLEQGFAKKESREREFLLFNATERYRTFLQEYPGLETRLRQHHIASYLGITPVALSRIRRAMKQNMQRVNTG